MVSTREIAEEYRLGHWAQVMQGREQSGLSIKAYCQQIGICGNRYYYWQRKLREAACAELLGQEQSVHEKPSEAPARGLVPSGWAVCEAAKAEGIEEDEAAAGGAGDTVAIEIGKCRVLAKPDTESEELARICRVLLSLC